MTNKPNDERLISHKEDWSYGELAELGIEVCASCGGSNISAHYKHTKEKPEYCYDCNFAEGTTICMPDDKTFYSEAKKTLEKITKEIKNDR